MELDLAHPELPDLVDWFPWCGRTNCSCMEPSLDGPCEEVVTDPDNPRCGRCGWPPYRHTPEPSGDEEIVAVGVTIYTRGEARYTIPLHLDRTYRSSDELLQGLQDLQEEVRALWPQ